MTKLEKLCEINKNPLWHLCRSNTENAISNFWAYLIEQTGSTKIILGPKYNYTVTKVKREQDHMDIQIYCKGDHIPSIIIENKVKSLASRNQIQQYRAYYPNSSFFLITPNGKKDFIESKITWISYKKIRDNIAKYQKKTNILYKNFLDLLIRIKKLATLPQKTYLKYCLLWGENKQAERDEFIEKLTKEKIYALMTKTLVQGYTKKFNLPKNPIIEIGFSRGAPLFSWKWQYDKNNLCGIQVQNRQLRFFIEAINKKKVPNRKILNNWLKECGYKGGMKDKNLHRSNQKNPKPNTFSGFFIYKYVFVLKERELNKKLKRIINIVKKNKQIISPSQDEK